MLYALFLEAMPQKHVLKDALFFLAHRGDRKALVQGKCISNEGVKSRDSFEGGGHKSYLEDKCQLPFVLVRTMMCGLKYLLLQNM